MAIPRKAFLGDICGDWLGHGITPELFGSDTVCPYFALVLSSFLYTYVYIHDIAKSIQSNIHMIVCS